MNNIFHPEQPLGKQLSAFLKMLKKDNGARAELKRCRDAMDVMMTPVFHQFFDKVVRDFDSKVVNIERWEVRVAMILGLMAHLKLDKPSVLSESKGNEKSFAGAFVLPMTYRDGNRPRVSELRFRRLLQRNADELYQPLIRVVKMMDGDANLYGLAESVFYWDQGDRIKKDWAFAYFPNVPAKEGI